MLSQENIRRTVDAAEWEKGSANSLIVSAEEMKFIQLNNNFSRK